ncbi:zinc metalloproteinase-disintegrin BlatH1 [Patella vulgata]|uniref:zinc metalloproteinase-disintegrin BlatH1 n=1 Tax=Patella vulgata TaxID=6465 RepID=UPI0024A9B086|nr:zinc metalloproteinase-disintegrin BlatH1 [Patella vulgata]
MRMPYSLMLLLPLCSYVNAEIVKIKFLEHSFTPNEREKRDVTSSMPDKMAFHLETDNGDTILNLERIATIPMYTFTENGLEKMNIASRCVAVYKDELRKSVIKISRQQDHLHMFHLEGEIEIDDKIHQLSPYNSLENEDGMDVFHVLQEKEEEIPVTDYFKDFRRIIKHKVSKVDSNNSRPKRSLEEHIYTVELCYIADHQDYQKFLSFNNNDVDNTTLDINIYYSFVTEQIRLRYESIYEQDPSLVINIVISGLILLKDKASSKFMDDEVYDTNQLDYNKGLDVAVEWLYINEDKLPPSDHYMFFTAYDLSDAGQSDSLGLANFGCMCYRDEEGYYLSASIIENAFDGNVGATAAHELGHSLDADHDSDVGCNDNDLYLMSARSIHPWNVSYASRPWKLSPCSVQSIGTFLRK